MSDKFHSISADDWRRSIAQSRARPNGVAAQIRQKLMDSIYWGYTGATNDYRVYVPGIGEVFRTPSPLDRDLFIAKLKIEIFL